LHSYKGGDCGYPGVEVIPIDIPGKRPALAVGVDASSTDIVVLVDSDVIWEPDVLAKLKSLRIPPSSPCTDAEFIRRAYLDAAGILPTPDEVRRFIAETTPDKRAKLIDALLERPEFVDYWAYKWSDLLLVSTRKLPTPAMLAMQIDGMSTQAKYMLVAGAVAGGGLTVIANAPNPAGVSLLRSGFDQGSIGAPGLLLGALGIVCAGAAQMVCWAFGGYSSPGVVVPLTPEMAHHLRQELPGFRAFEA
jgi:hypothetical protein